MTSGLRTEARTRAFDFYVALRAFALQTMNKEHHR